jgi:hypothetical protein
LDINKNWHKNDLNDDISDIYRIIVGQIVTDRPTRQGYSMKYEMLIAKWMDLTITYNFYTLCVNAIFNNISVISWRSVLLVEETGGPVENHRPAASH